MANSSESSKNTKRRLRAPSPTVRQAAEKAVNRNEQPKKQRFHSAARQAGKPFAKLGALLSKVFNRQPFRFIGLILHFIGLIVWPRFFRNALRELRQVTWLTAKETRQLTIAVLAFAVVFGVLVTIVDYGLDKIFKAVILK